MTSAHQMSSRKPPVAQSTFGFPDDSTTARGLSSPQPTSSAHRLSVGMLTPPAHLLCSPSRTLPPAHLGAPQKMREALFPPPPSPSLCLSWLNFATLQNVEKRSFQARLNCLYRQLEKIFTIPKCNIFPNPSRSIARTAPCLPPRLPARTLRPLLEAPAFLRAFASCAGDQKNVEKLSFQAPLSAVNREPKKFCKLNWPGICRTFHTPHPAPDPRPISGLPLPGLSRPQPTLPIVPSHCFPSLSSLPSLRTTPLSFPVRCLGELGGRPSRSRKNVEKLSFGPHRLACTSRPKKLFHPQIQHFPAFAHFPLLTIHPLQPMFPMP